MAVAGCPPWQLRWPADAAGAIASPACCAPWPTSRLHGNCPFHGARATQSPGCHGGWGQHGDNGGGAVPVTLLHYPWSPPSPRQPHPSYLRLRLLHLVLHLHELFVDLLQPGRPDLGGGGHRVGVSGGWDPPPPGPPESGMRAQGLEATGQGAQGWVRGCTGVMQGGKGIELGVRSWVRGAGCGELGVRSWVQGAGCPGLAVTQFDAG